MKNLCMVIGPIASGKSSLLDPLVEIFGLQGYELISTDVYFQERFLTDTDPIDLCYRRARAFTEYKLRKARAAGKDILWETVVGKESKIEKLTAFKEQGYRIFVVFACVRDVELCVERAKTRGEKVGYSPAEGKVRKRYEDSFAYLSKVNALADELLIIDNSVAPKAVLWRQGNQIQVIDGKECEKAWIDKIKACIS